MQVKSSFLAAEVMKSLSNVFKRVVFEKENPIKLKEYYLATKKNNKEYNKEIINGSDLTYEKLYDDKAKQLLDEAFLKAREIIEKSKAEAAELISRAHAEKEKIEKDAYDKGYMEGIETALKDQQVKWNEHVKELTQTLQELNQQNNLYRKYLEKECLKLSLAVAEKVLCKKIQENDNAYFLDLIRNGMEKAGEEKNILIRVSENDFERVKLMISDLKDELKKTTIIKDPFLSSGDCIIEGPHFEIDAGVHTQIENIRLALRELEVIDDA